MADLRIDEIDLSCQRLIPAGMVAELRVPKSVFGLMSGYFDNAKKLADAARALNGKSDGIYITLNPVDNGLLDRAPNEARRNPKRATTDSDILRRIWLPLDFDPIRKPGTSSTNEEHDGALTRARACRDYLKEQGWPEPIYCDSGNGAHLLYRIDLPNDTDSCDLVRRVIESLTLHFSDETIDLDVKTYNAARIMKLYGTLAAKGENTIERPHRLSRILECPEKLEVLTQSMLQRVAIAAKLTVADVRKGFDLRKWLAEHKLAVASERPLTGGGTKFILTQCPFNPEHRDRAAVALQLTSGAVAFRCLHNSCAGRNWHELRQTFEPGRATTQSAWTGTGSALLKRGTWITLDTVTPRTLNWLWPQRVPAGMVTTFAGDPSLGKSLLNFDFIARGSVGADFLDGTRNETGRFASLILSSEDDRETVIVPRLMAAGADLGMIEAIDTVKFINDKQEVKDERGISIESDLEIIRQRIKDRPEIRYVMIDPLANYLGAKNINKEQEVRQVLMPVVALAQDLNVSIGIISHNSKQEGRSAMHKVIGAVGAVGVTRMGWSFIKSPKDPDRLREMLVMKENLGKFDGILFSTESVEVEIGGKKTSQARIKFEGSSSSSIENLLARQEDPAQRRASRAEQLIKKLVPKGQPVSCAPIFAEAEKQGIAERTLKQARVDLGVATEKKRDGWYWSWPTEAEQ